MLPDYRDITDRIGTAPLWFDKHGVPRYATFDPRMVGVYATWVCFMEIACQLCAQRFFVAVDYDELALRSFLDPGQKLPTLREEAFPRENKGGVLGAGAFHYGDPPRHGCVGDTMNSLTVRVVEFWRHGRYVAREPQWIRLPEREVYLGEQETLDE